MMGARFQPGQDPLPETPPPPGRDSLRARFFDLYIQSIDLITANAAWFVLSLPLVTMLPATGGLFYAMNRAAHEEQGDWRAVWRGFRRYFWVSWQWGGLAGLGFGVLWVNIWFYGQRPEGWAVWVRALAGWLFVLWGVVQAYTFPLLMEQEAPRLGLAVRNSAVLLVRRPLPMLGWAGAAFVLGVGSSVLAPAAWMVITASVCVYLLNLGVVRELARRGG